MRARTALACITAAAISGSAHAQFDDTVVDLGEFYCWGLGYTGGRANDAYYILYQHLSGYHEYPIVIYYAKYVPGQGFTDQNLPLLADMPSSMHPYMGYWGGQYHVGWLTDPRDRLQMVDADSFADFRTIDATVDAYDITGSLTHNNPVPSAYGFDDTLGWVLYCSLESDGHYYIKYVPWEESAGWKPGVVIPTTESTSLLGEPTVLTLGPEWWRVYFIKSFGNPEAATVWYVETLDGGATWSTNKTTNGLSTHHWYSRLSIGRYGDNLWMFLVDKAGHSVVHRSTDGVNWSPAETLLDDSVYYDQHGTLIGQSHLLSTMSDTQYFDNWGAGIGDQYAVIRPISPVSAFPKVPTQPVPSDGERLPKDTEAIELAVTVAGPQSYDVGFYLADGTFIGEDRNLRTGDVARVELARLEPDSTVSWYAVARGATGAYWGGPPAATTDERISPVWSFDVGRVCKADFNEDGVLDTRDVLEFLNAFTAGCDDD